MRDIKPSAKRLEDFLREKVLPIAGVLKIYWGENLHENATSPRWCLKGGSPLLIVQMINRSIIIVVEDGTDWAVREEINKITNHTNLILGRSFEITEADIPSSQIL